MKISEKKISSNVPADSPKADSSEGSDADSAQDSDESESDRSEARSSDREASWVESSTSYNSDGDQDVSESDSDHGSDHDSDCDSDSDASESDSEASEGNILKSYGGRETAALKAEPLFGLNDSAVVAAASTSSSSSSSSPSTGAETAVRSASAIQPPTLEGQIKVPDECAVCLEPLLANTIALACRHLLHEACLDSMRSAALKNVQDGKGNGKVCCPLCNAEQKMTPEHTISGALNGSATSEKPKHDVVTPGGGGFSFGAPAGSVASPSSSSSPDATKAPAGSGGGFSFGAPASSVASPSSLS